MKILDSSIILTTITLSKSTKLRAFVTVIFLVKSMLVMTSCIHGTPKIEKLRRQIRVSFNS
jgi:hypothetical protein